MSLIHGDSLHELRDLPDDLFTAIVTDPPYGLEFMGKGWDKVLPPVDIWREALRVLKPGGHALVFGGTRTYHRLACSLEDAGFEIRDCLMWLYGQGFPKSLDVSKAIDKAAGAEREKVPASGGLHNNKNLNDDGWSKIGAIAPMMDSDKAVTAAAAAAWSGYGTALKPAWEPIILARKPLVGTVERNCREHGTGALNIGGCRIGTEGGTRRGDGVGYKGTSFDCGNFGVVPLDAGRWPANVILDGSAAAQLDAQVEASRFFYCAKASKSDRGEDNNHPTVKPVELMRWLVRLVKGPQDNLILDPFAGSGTTGVAAQLEDVPFILIEREAAYAAIIEKRLSTCE